jgi:hypothetical protein
VVSNCACVSCSLPCVDTSSCSTSNPRAITSSLGPRGPGRVTKTAQVRSNVVCATNDLRCHTLCRGGWRKRDKHTQLTLYVAINLTDLTLYGAKEKKPNKSAHAWGTIPTAPRLAYCRIDSLTTEV